MTFEPRTLADGRVCCSQPHALCDACRSHFGVADAAYGDNQQQHFRAAETADIATAPNPYEPQLQILRAANDRRLSPFEAKWKERRLAELAAEYARAQEQP